MPTAQRLPEQAACPMPDVNRPPLEKSEGERREGHILGGHWEVIKRLFGGY